MENHKIIFIGLKELDIEGKGAQLKKELETYANWFKKEKPYNPIIISSCIKACINFAQALSEALKYSLKYLNSLSENQPFDSSPLESKSLLPESLYPNKIDPLLHYAYNNHDLCIIVLEESLYSSFNLNSQSRSYKLSCYHDVYLQDEKKKNLGSNTLIEYQEKMMNYANEITKYNFDSTVEAFQSLSHKLETVPEEVKTISKAISSEFSKSQRNFLQCVRKNNDIIINVLEKIEELQSTAEFYKEIADLYILSNRCSENARARISSLKPKYDKFVLKIVNETKEDLKSVQIMVCENREIKGKIRFLQGLCTVYLDLKLEDDDFYKHMVVVSGDTVVSDVFVIFPLIIEKDKYFKENSLIKLSNLTNNQIHEIKLASTNSIWNIMHLHQGLNAKKSTYIKVPKENLIGSLLLISDSQQASNLLIISN